MDASAGGDDLDLVEVGVARDSFEAMVWSRHLSEQGIPVRTETRGSWLHLLFYLGRRPIAVLVPRGDLERAREFLTRYRFI